MYETPQLQRLGTLQDLTLGGGAFATDLNVPNQGCEGGPIGNPYTCHTAS